MQQHHIIPTTYLWTREELQKYHNKQLRGLVRNHKTSMQKTITYMKIKQKLRGTKYSGILSSKKYMHFWST